MLYPAISVDGCTITPSTLADWSQGKVGIYAELADFLTEWWAPSPTMKLHTSGSTGAPKVMQATKTAMAASAAATCRFFNLQPGNSALLCLPLRYIAGKMMVVRALAGGLKLITAPPSSVPLTSLQEQVDFAPLVPMQVHHTLALSDGAEQLSKVRTILLGGGFIDSTLEAQLQELPTHFFASYGMTETLSHIALRQLNGSRKSQFYTPLPDVSIELTPSGTLQISAPYLGIEHLRTNDLAEIMADGTFRITGRVDAVINSGGIKIQAEQLEQELTSHTGLQVLALPLSHPTLGQCVALLWEGEADAEARLRKACNSLPRYHRPHVMHRTCIPRTASGKPARAKALKLLTQLTKP